MPRVSVLIPTYDRPDFLGEAVDAALGSSFTDIEVIVGDNGDLGGAVCAGRTDPRLRYHSHDEQLGMAGNWNALLDMAAGELVALCSDDDRIASTFIEQCVGCFDTDSGLGVVFTNHDFVSETTRETRVCALPGGRHDAFAPMFLKHLPVAASAAVFRREAWEQVRPMPDTAAADMVLFGRLAEAGYPFFYIDESLMDYRTHGAMLSSTDGFKDDGVIAWGSLCFSDPDAEARRRRLLGQALLSRAAVRGRDGEGTRARSDARAAARLLLGRQRLKAAAMLALAAVPGGIGAASSAVRTARGLARSAQKSA